MARRAFREPMLWLVIGIPLASLLAGIGMLSVAGGTGATDPADADARRTGQAQTRDLAADRAALEQGLHARLQASAGRLSLHGLASGSQPLRLHLRHPFDAGRDIELSLQATADGWQGEGGIPPGNDWRLELLPEDGRWRLVGRCRQGEPACELHPALAGRR